MSAARSPAENWQIFVQSIKGVLLKWAAWRLAIENSWGGPATDAKEDQLWQNIAAYFSSGKEPHWDELAASIDLFTIDNLNVEIDDGSLDAVAQQLVRLYISCRGGDVTEALQYVSAEKVAVQAVEAKGMDSDDSEVSDGDEAANQQLQQQYLQNGGMIEGGGAAAAPSRPGPQMDEDGFISVVPKGRGR